MQSLTINPHQQCLDVWHWVMSWQDLLSTTILAAILEKNFMGRWLNVLYNWLSNGPNLDEVSKWYSGWKSMLSPQLLEHPSIKDGLKRALDMMNAFSCNINLPVQPFHAFYGSIRPQHMTPNNSISSKEVVSDVSINFKQLVERRPKRREYYLFRLRTDSMTGNKCSNSANLWYIWIDKCFHTQQQRMGSHITPVPH